MEPETRDQTAAKLEFYIPRLTDSEMRLVAAFVRGLIRGRDQA